MSRGRNRELIRKRDAKLCQRYYYWTEVKRLRFDDTLRLLSEEEFFISEERILAIIRQMSHISSSISPVSRVKLPKLSYRQLSLFRDKEGYPVSQIRRGSKT
jgi:hypothetical protein